MKFATVIYTDGRTLPPDRTCQAQGGTAGMLQLVNVSSRPGSFGVLLRVCRRRAYLSQEQLAARADLSERMVRNLETGRVRLPRLNTVRLLADALQLGEPERERWFEAARQCHVAVWRA